MDTSTGTVAWVSNLPRYKNPKSQSDPIAWFGPTMAAERLVFGGTNQRAIAVSPYDGKILGERKLPDNASLAPIVAASTLFMITADGSLLAFR